MTSQKSWFFAILPAYIHENQLKTLVDHLFQILYTAVIVNKKEQDMSYTLITKNGKILQFYVEAVARTFQANFGGVIITDQILVDQKTQIKL